MKRLLFLLLLFFVIFPTISSAGSSPDPDSTHKPDNHRTTSLTSFGTIPFITTWKTDNPGTSAPNQITIPTSLGETYNYTVDWGDTTTTTGETGDATHTYATAGTYTVQITGTFPRIYFRDQGDKDKILTIEQWGDNPWTSMWLAFWGCSNLEGNFIDVPDLSNVTNMALMFAKCTLYNSDMNNWNVSNVTQMEGLFKEATSFNGAIGNWDTSNVTVMGEMFSGASVFNQDIGNWNTSNATNMGAMFQGASVFNQDINFKPGAGIPSGDAWNTGAVRYMTNMFRSATVFNQNIGDWDTGNVEGMTSMFNSATVFNQDIGRWNVGKVEQINAMFSNATSFNQDIGDWDVRNVKTSLLLFGNATSFNQDIGRWVTTSITNTSQMFFGATSFNQDIGGWDVSNVTDITRMFYNASSFDQDLSAWNVEEVTAASTMFGGVTLSTVNYDALLIGWNAQNLQPNVTFSGGNSRYCGGAVAKANMIASDNWSVSDGGSAGPIVNDLADQTQANSYTLPIITGTNLTGNESYFTGPNGTGTAYLAGSTINYSDFPSYPVTIYIYDETGTSPNCEDEQDFLLTITNACTPPTADNPADVIECDSYTLPALSLNNNYYTATIAGGIQLNVGDVISTSQTIYVYVGTSSCSDENSFTITINTSPSADSPSNITECTGYILPALSANNEYYTATNKGGTQLNTGDNITATQTIYVYTETGTTPNICSYENSFVVTISGNPTADSPSHVTECTSYTLPALGPNNNYFTATNGGGTQLNAGDLITSTQRLYIYIETGIAPYTCSDESIFDVTIVGSPTADNPSDVTSCESYILPDPLADNYYYTDTGASGNQLNGGDVITSSQTIYVYTGTTGCSDENSFLVTIDSTVTVDKIDDVTECEIYLLPTLTYGNYFTDPEGQGTELFAGDSITSAKTIYIYFELDTCNDESSFDVTIDPSECEEVPTNTCELKFPKFFTPNSDGNNDRFQVMENTCNNEGNIRIYDRYGRLLFQTDTSGIGWGGNFKGTPLPETDYWYQFINAENGQVSTGHFSLKR